MFAKSYNFLFDKILGTNLFFKKNIRNVKMTVEAILALKIIIL